MNIYAGNIPRETSETELRDAFGKFGAVESVTMIKDRYTNTFKGFAFIEMPNKEEAETAIKEMDGTMFSGRPLTVNAAKPKTDTRNKPKRYNTGY
jgi:RNA recognition motif-containing protein